MSGLLNDCSGKVALVTGAATGIGRACAVALAAAGASLIVTDIDTDGVEKTADMVNRAGGTARALAQDVASEETWAAILADIKAHEGRLNVLVNNAGIAIGVSILEMSLADWQRQTAINLDGVFLGCKYAIPLMAESGAGSIINISSIAGLRGAAGLAGYCATKGGVRLFSKSVAAECAAGGLPIRCNSVHPGIIDTDIWGREIAGIAQNNPDMMNEGGNRINIDLVAAAGVPGGKPGHPDDIANGVVYLASDASSYVNGSELVIDYAMTAG
jgi:NAD(P)-dependent dehydrogenase (short-subunit alcohol dehydrogenase family)